MRFGCRTASDFSRKVSDTKESLSRHNFFVSLETRKDLHVNVQGESKTLHFLNSHRKIKREDSLLLSHNYPQDKNENENDDDDEECVFGHPPVQQYHGSADDRSRLVDVLVVDQQQQSPRDQIVVETRESFVIQSPSPIKRQ